MAISGDLGGQGKRVQLREVVGWVELKGRPKRVGSLLAPPLAHERHAEIVEHEWLGRREGQAGSVVLFCDLRIVLEPSVAQQRLELGNERGQVYCPLRRSPRVEPASEGDQGLTNQLMGRSVLRNDPERRLARRERVCG
jgi:hypothetical protein